jgi:tetratricopeptide (TPR) repeat protein
VKVPYRIAGLAGWTYRPIAFRRNDRRDEALAAIVRASVVDPVSPLILTELAWNWFMAREFEQALSHAIEALDLQPGFSPAFFVLGLACEQLGRYEQALEAFRTAAVQTPNPALLASEAHLLAVMGRPDQASGQATKQIESRAGQSPPRGMACPVASGRPG